MSKKKIITIIKNSYFWASIAEASTISFTDGGEMCLNLIPCDKKKKKKSYFSTNQLLNNPVQCTVQRILAII